MIVELKETSLLGKFEEYGSYVLEGGYLFDQENEAAVNRCIEIFANDDPGLLLVGNPGSGKTLLFEMLQRVISMHDPLHFIKVNTGDVVLQFNNKEVGHEVFKKWIDKNIFFDDLGAEKKGRHYGESLEVFEEVIQRRYELWRHKKLKTYFTSNLGKTELINRYGMRCMSRLNEMCIRVDLGASENYKDRRLLRNFKELPYVKHPVYMSEDDKYIQDVYKALKEVAKDHPKSVPGLGQRVKMNLGTDKPKT